MAMDPTRLWAKSKLDHETERPSMFLPGHLADVHAAAERVLTATADDQLSALGLAVPTHKERLRRCVLLAAAVHDLGKANDHFQGMLLRNSDRRQALANPFRTGKQQARRERAAGDGARQQIDQPHVADNVPEGHCRMLPRR